VFRKEDFILDPNFTGKLLPPEGYWDSATYDREMDAVAKRCWNFAGLIGDLPRKNDFLTVTIGEHSVIVQNFGDEIRAFDNVCSHRYAYSIG
jgi:phenylpropionate dioxygenase-like ring-hydroxylating dioxygenase large terminal subunit